MHIHSLSAREFCRELAALDRDGAHVISIAVQQNGDIAVLSPFDANWTQNFLLNAGIGIPAGTMN